MTLYKHPSNFTSFAYLAKEPHPFQKRGFFRGVTNFEMGITKRNELDHITSFGPSYQFDEDQKFVGRRV